MAEKPNYRFRRMTPEEYHKAKKTREMPNWYSRTESPYEYFAEDLAEYDKKFGGADANESKPLKAASTKRANRETLASSKKQQVTRSTAGNENSEPKAELGDENNIHGIMRENPYEDDVARGNENARNLELRDNSQKDPFTLAGESRYGYRKQRGYLYNMLMSGEISRDEYNALRKLNRADRRLGRANEYYEIHRDEINDYDNQEDADRRFQKYTDRVVKANLRGRNASSRLSANAIEAWRKAKSESDADYERDKRDEDIPGTDSYKRKKFEESHSQFSRGGKLVSRRMMEGKFGRPLKEDGDSEYYLD